MITVSYAHAREVGDRSHQEDGYIEVPDLNYPDKTEDEVPSDPKRVSVFAVIDGHAGNGLRQHVQKNFIAAVAAHPGMASCEYERVIADSQKEMDRTWRVIQDTVEDVKAVDNSGCCMTAVLIVGNDCYVGHIGDTRMVRFTADKPEIQVTRDHKPNDPIEMARIEAAGATVQQATSVIPGFLCCAAKTVPKGPPRVVPGKLAVARSIGTLAAKQERFGCCEGAIVCEPECHKFTLSGEDEYLIMCSDGVWDMMKTKKNGEEETDNGKVRKKAKQATTEYYRMEIGSKVEMTPKLRNKATKALAECYVDESISMGSRKFDHSQDNTTCVCLRFNTWAEPKWK